MQSDQIRLQLVSMYLNTVKSPKIFKLEQHYFDKVHQNKTKSKKNVKTTLIIDILKSYQKRYKKDQDFFVFQKHQNKHIKVPSIFYPSKLH